VRTTLNISDDLLAEAKVLAARTHRSIAHRPSGGQPITARDEV
jgi:hypothetical protein